MNEHQTSARSSLPIRHALAACLLASTSACSWVGLVSVNSDGEQADGYSYAPSVSADGRYVAFESGANNLSAPNNFLFDVFVRDTLAGTTTQVSLNNVGNGGVLSSVQPAISGDGRYVAFASQQPFVAGDNNTSHDVFLRDTQTATTSRISVDSAEIGANLGGLNPSVSSDAHFVAFDSLSDNLVTGDENVTWDTFVRDTQLGLTTRISVSSAGIEGNNTSKKASISSNGQYVAYASRASNLVADDGNAVSDIFVRDRTAGTTSRISLDSDDNQGNDDSEDAAISGDGRYVAYRSDATNLVVGDGNGVSDIFVRDRDTGTTKRVSMDTAGLQANAASDTPAISGDGRYIAFRSSASNLVADDTNGLDDIFVHDQVAGTTIRVSLDAVGTQADGMSDSPSVSADGRYLAYSSDASNLVSSDVNGQRDIVLKAIPQLSITSVTPGTLSIGATTAVTISGANFLVGTVLKINGVQLDNIEVVDENTITVDVTVADGTSPGEKNVMVMLFGTGPGQYTGASAMCPSCVELF